MTQPLFPWFPAFLACLGGGMASLLPGLKVQEVGPLFFRFMALVCAVLCGAAAWMFARGEGLTLRAAAPAVLAALCAALIPLRGRAVAAGRTLLWAAPPLVLLFLWAATGNWLLTADLALGALFVSSVTFTMILGHWYLVNRNLDFIHLMRYSRLFLWSGLLRPAGWALAFALPAAQRPTWARLFDLRGEGLWVLPRLLAGWMIPLVAAWMILETVRIRNNQSATGILYAAIPLAFGGEMAAFFGAARLGWLL